VGVSPAQPAARASKRETPSTTPIEIELLAWLGLHLDWRLIADIHHMYHASAVVFRIPSPDINPLISFTADCGNLDYMISESPQQQ
jgi:hypothetical protein